MRRIFLTGITASVVCTAAAQEGVRFYDKTNRMPAAVTEQVTCDMVEPGAGIGQPFAGGFLFRVRCPSNHANHNQALVLADDEDGRGARLLRFPQPDRKAAPAEEISNVQLFPQTRELTEISVDPENEKICRTEGRWRLAATDKQPTLVFWRETRDCDGKRGWRVIVKR